MPLEAGIIEISNLALTIILLLKVAALEQAVLKSDQVDYSGSPTLELIRGVKP
jgi:hypothetical protein